MNNETKDKIQIIADNLDSLADKIRNLPEEKDVNASLPVISAALKMQARDLKELIKE